MSPSRKQRERRTETVRKILNRHDPVGLIRSGAPEDEYDPEIPGVLSAIEQASDEHNLTDRLHRVFKVQFGGGDSGGTREQMVGIAKDLWRASRSRQW